MATPSLPGLFLPFPPPLLVVVVVLVTLEALKSYTGLYKGKKKDSKVHLRTCFENTPSYVLMVKHQFEPEKQNRQLGLSLWSARLLNAANGFMKEGWETQGSSSQTSCPVRLQRDAPLKLRLVYRWIKCFKCKNCFRWSWFCFLWVSDLEWSVF